MSEQFDPQVDPVDDVNSTSSFSAISTGIDSESDATFTSRGLRAEEQQAIDSLPAGSALLIALSGPNSGARFLLNEDKTNAGRHVRSDIFLDDTTVSRKHAQFVRENDQFFVRDSGSLNGTYVNRERIDFHPLKTGDEVQIGKFRLTFYGHKGNA
ncbi:MAG: FHA domain-containing protein [Actinomycetaceae bacterium]|nr:FHA domain-containing protein [Actinomycetaceae bacterium]